MTQATQMNVRIAPTLKAEGDLAFSRAGLTPSGAVRLLYQLAIKHRYDPDQLLSALEAETDFSENNKDLRETASKGRRLYQDFCTKLGLACIGPASQMSYEELREMSLMERFGE